MFFFSFSEPISIYQPLLINLLKTLFIGSGSFVWPFWFHVFDFAKPVIPSPSSRPGRNKVTSAAHAWSPVRDTRSDEHFLRAARDVYIRGTGKEVARNIRTEREVSLLDRVITCT